MAPSKLETSRHEMDIRAADCDRREIEALDQKGVAAVGKLTSLDWSPSSLGVLPNLLPLRSAHYLSCSSR